MRRKLIEDITGLKINRIKVLNKAEKPPGVLRDHYWKCICDCGVEFVASKSNLFCNKESCGCTRKKHKMGSKHYNWQGHAEICKTKWTAIRNSSMRRGLSFNITIEYGWQLFLEQDRKCVLSGVDLFFSSSHDSSGNASLDRIDSKIGYEIGNVQWIDKKIQPVKMNMPEDEFFYLCEMVAIHKGKV